MIVNVKLIKLFIKINDNKWMSINVGYYEQCIIKIVTM